MVDTPTPQEQTEQQEPTFQVNTEGMEAARRRQWRGAIEQELQACVQQAAAIRQNINTAKTQYKKTFYQKKFTKIQTKVMQMVGALQRLQMHEAQAAAKQQQEAAPPQEEHIHDENCQHSHADE